MCQFFSFLSNGKGKYFYFNAQQRADILSGKIKDVESPDSHSAIAKYYMGNGLEDGCNKFEYVPIIKKFVVDQINIKGCDDSKEAEKWVLSLDFKTIIPELIEHEIIHPLKIKKIDNVSDVEKHLLAVWASVRASVGDSVWASVGDSVWDSVRDSVRDSVGDSVWDSVRDSVGDSVRDSVGDSVWDSVRDSVGDSVWDSVWDSVGAYTGSFFNLKKSQWKYCEKVDFKDGENPFQSCIDLWNMGLVPSFDGKKWRLRSGDKAEIVLKITPEELKRYL